MVYQAGNPYSKMGSHHVNGRGQPDVSVVLPTYNHAPVLERAIRSVLAQTFTNLELIVVDDGSTDNSREIIYGFDDPRVSYLRTPRRCGATAARNLGARASRARLLAFQDGDDEWAIDKLRIQYLAYEKAQPRSHCLVCGAYIIRPASGKTLYVRPDERMRRGDWAADNIHDFSFIASTWLIPQATFEALGGFDEGMAGQKGREMAIRLFSSGEPGQIIALDEPLLIQHASADSSASHPEGSIVASKARTVTQGPLVSVVLPIFNRADLLARSAGSVLAQTYRNLELIVVDDASSEDVEAAVQALADPRVRYIRRELNGGPAAARNTGIEAATGEYVAFQDSDDEWLLDKLAIQVDVLQQNPDTALCLGTVLRLIDGNLLVFSLASATPSLAQIAALQQGYTQALVVKRQVLLAIGGFDTRLWIWEDWELLLRITESYPVRSAVNSLVITERGHDSVTRSKDRFIQSAQYIVEKHELIFSSLPIQWSHFYYKLAHKLVDASGTKSAAGTFFKACRVNPSNWRAWVYLLLCLLRAKWLILRLRGSLAALKQD